jgi:hypothetical protein
VARFVVKNRRMVVDGECYTCSVAQGLEGMELLVYQDKRPFFRLGQNWAEAWGIDLYRPGVMAQAIRYYRQKGMPKEPQQLCREPELFSRLTGLCFSPDEREEKEWFLNICGRMRQQLESEATIKPEGECEL